MLFQHTLPQVLANQKTQTRRIIKTGEHPLVESDKIEAVLQSGRTKWKVDKTYAIQPRRGSKQVGRLKITGIRCEEVQKITPEDAKQEGFANKNEFFATWQIIHGAESLKQKAWILEFEVIEINE